MARGGRVALQTVLGAVGGGLQGYQQERARKKQEEQLRKAEERQARMDILDLLDRGAIQQAAPGESVLGDIPSAVPMVAPSSSAMAEALRTAAPSTSAGSLGMEIGGQRFVMPSKAQREAQAQQRALTASVEQARATGEVQREFAKQAADEAEQTAFNQLTALGQERGPFKSGAGYANRLAHYYRMQEIEAGRKPTALQLAQLDLDRQRLELSRQAQQTKASDAEWRQSKLPAAASAKLYNIEAGLGMVAGVRDAINQYPNALGGAKNLLWGQLTDRIDPRGVGVRASVEALTGEIRNQRFGGALTENEARFAATFLPESRDRADNALEKLKQLEAYLEQKRKAVYTVYGGQYRSLSGTSAADQLADAAGGTALEPAAGGTTATTATGVAADTTAASASPVGAAMTPRQFADSTGIAPMASPAPRRDFSTALRQTGPMARQAMRDALTFAPAESTASPFRMPSARPSAGAGQTPGPRNPALTSARDIAAMRMAQDSMASPVNIRSVQYGGAAAADRPMPPTFIAPPPPPDLTRFSAQTPMPFGASATPQRPISSLGRALSLATPVQTLATRPVATPLSPDEVAQAMMRRDALRQAIVTMSPRSPQYAGLVQELSSLESLLQGREDLSQMLLNPPPSSF